MKKVLFIDRDGTLIHEPEIDWQVDSYDKFEFIPGVIRNLGRIAEELDYMLVMVTNQDGLGTSSYPEETFWPVHNKMLTIFSNEGIVFEDVFIDRSFEHQNLPTRKPGIGMLSKFLQKGYDLENSYVIGDRKTDIQLAENLGAKGIYFNANEDLPKDLLHLTPLQTTSWKEIYQFLKKEHRFGKVFRKTNETSIQIRLNLDGQGLSEINTGIGFFDHMLDQITRHGGFDLFLQANGDLHIDEHHTIEDTGLALGEAFKNAVGKKTGMQRYGFSLPMDDANAKVLLDFGGRPYFKWKFKSADRKPGGISVGLFEHFFRSFSDASACNLHISAKGKDGHHTIEAVFKAFARALKMASERDLESGILPTTKGVL
ncbi:MAG: bifunctional histidinol-phosphatase/imidazoleglycerol-phosphate dehydratase HisB [Bacteroidetes bacterium]|nr:bifunctional histidinol-phosphatase/imidazoleglycerol-phosphate dehydratase HisB [Bacteroidota bacterium]